jgi:hypothetical protein
MYLQRVHFYPNVGKEAELRAVLEERVKTGPRRNVRSGLAEQMFVTEGQSFSFLTCTRTWLPTKGYAMGTGLTQVSAISKRKSFHWFGNLRNKSSSTC